MQHNSNLNDGSGGEEETIHPSSVSTEENISRPGGGGKKLPTATATMTTKPIEDGLEWDEERGAASDLKSAQTRQESQSPEVKVIATSPPKAPGESAAAACSTSSKMEKDRLNIGMPTPVMVSSVTGTDSDADAFVLNSKAPGDSSGGSSKGDAAKNNADERMERGTTVSSGNTNTMPCNNNGPVPPPPAPEETQGTRNSLPGGYAVGGPGAHTYDQNSDGVGSSAIIDLESSPGGGSCELMVEAHAVEEEEEEGGPATEAVVVETIFGVDRKRFYIMACLATTVMAVVLAIAVPLSQNQATQKAAQDAANRVCGPLCGSPGELPPDPTKMVLGQTCQEWDANSANLPIPSGESCTSQYAPAAYGCGCPEAAPPLDGGCPSLCSDGSDLPDPDLEVTYPFHHQTLKCGDWQLKSLFETNTTECPFYNALGVLCGCPSNEPHPDSCGTLCEGGFENKGILDEYSWLIWGIKCGDWDVWSQYLPSWYQNPNDESCTDYYFDVAYGCGCSETRRPPLTAAEEFVEEVPPCGTLCQELRTCPDICRHNGEDGGGMADPSRMVRRDSCRGWELQARTAQKPICNFYDMLGVQCGCHHDAPLNSYSNKCDIDFCGGDLESIPDVDKVVGGQTCGDWYHMSYYLPEDYGRDIQGWQGFIDDCKMVRRIEYGCGCVPEPPEGTCGRLCKDGGTLPDPSRVVGGRLCRDWELYSLFDVDTESCGKYDLVTNTCGCNDDWEYPHSCFEYEHLNERTWYFAPGGNFQFIISFGESGYFSLAQNTNNLDRVKVGFYQGKGSGHGDNVIAYGGGVFCGPNGPATAIVSIIEDETVSKPKLVSLSESAICTYYATMHVPKFCEPKSDEL